MTGLSEMGADLNFRNRVRQIVRTVVNPFAFELSLGRYRDNPDDYQDDDYDVQISGTAENTGSMEILLCSFNVRMTAGDEIIGTERIPVFESVPAGEKLRVFHPLPLPGNMRPSNRIELEVVGQYFSLSGAISDCA